MQQLPQELIIKALALTGKTIHDMKQDVYHDFNWDTNFSIEKFCFYLLSLEFIKAYIEKWWWDTKWIDLTNAILLTMWIATNEYQKWNSQPLIDLLYKI